MEPCRPYLRVTSKRSTPPFHNRPLLAFHHTTVTTVYVVLVAIFSTTMAQASALLKSRVARPSYLKKLANAEDLVHHFPNGAYVGWSGFTGKQYRIALTDLLR